MLVMSRTVDVFATTMKEVVGAISSLQSGKAKSEEIKEPLSIQQFNDDLRVLPFKYIIQDTGTIYS